MALSSSENKSKPTKNNKKGGHQSIVGSFGNVVTVALVVAMAAMGLVFSGSPFSGPGYSVQVFTDLFKDSMCQKYHEDILALKDQLAQAEANATKSAQVKEEEKLNENVVMGAKPKPTRFCKLSSRSNYNAEKAIAKRRKHLVKKCQEFADVMTPSSMMTDYLPKSYTYHVDPESKTAICAIKGIGKDYYRHLIMKNRKPSDTSSLSNNVKEDLAMGLKLINTKVIIVRHPFERLVSAYRANFAGYYDPKADKQIPAKAGFPEFVDIVTGGYEELAKYMDDNRMRGESLGLDTSMVDGTGISSAWNPYWAACGVCNPKARPDLILDANHLDKDLPVLWDTLGGSEADRKLVEGKFEFESSNELTLEHYYSQVSKADIRKLAQKYKTDMDLFGYDPEYFINMGKDE